MFDAFDALVVGVAEPYFPSSFEGFFLDCKAVVLGSDVAVSGVDVDAGLVLGTVSKFEFVGFGSRGDGHHLGAEADAKDWFFEGESFFDDFV